MVDIMWENTTPGTIYFVPLQPSIVLVFSIFFFRFTDGDASSIGNLDQITTMISSEYRGHPFRVSGIFPSTYHQGSVQQ